MWIVSDRVEECGGIARTAELLATGLYRDQIEMAVYYDRIRRIRPGYYATHEADENAVLACKIGGRLACVSALAHAGESEPPKAVHIAVHRSASRLRIPEDRDIVIHWSRRPLTGNRISVSLDVARHQAKNCAGM